ncbi:MAG TPA: hypothetical protein VF759_07380 [Allosphingosinicella sp.]|jgi:hypothetical protein
MKKILLSMAAVGALAVAAPAVAQSGYSNVNAGGAVGISNRIAQLDARLQAGIQAGVIDRTEARSLRMQIRQLSRLEGQYSYNGLTQAERADLRTRLRTVRQNLSLADGGRFDRDNRYSWDDRYDNDGVYTQRVDRDRDGWDDRDFNRDGRIDDGYTGRGGPYEQPYDTACDTRSGIGGIIDGVLGRDNCGLRVGSRATGNLYSVPSQYRYQFRDGNGVYYRSDGRQIYQIDARTDTILRVYAMDR